MTKLNAFLGALFSLFALVARFPWLAEPLLVGATIGMLAVTCLVLVCAGGSGSRAQAVDEHVRRQIAQQIPQLSAREDNAYRMYVETRVPPARVMAETEAMSAPEMIAAVRRYRDRYNRVDYK